MAEEIRRRKTADPEMDAILVIAQALDPLTRAQAARVLTWAEERYTKVALPGLEMDQMDGVTKFMQAAAQIASRLNMANSQELIRAMGKVADELPHDDERVPA